MRRLPLLLILIPFLLFAGCSDDGDSNPQPTATQAVSSETPGSTQDAAIQGTIKVDFTGSPQELEPIDATFEVPPGATAWDAIKMALGEENVSSEDFGGDLGVFVTGFNGVEVEGNHFWEFRINGEGAEVGVGAYEVQQGDVLEFVYSSF